MKLPYLGPPPQSLTETWTDETFEWFTQYVTRHELANHKTRQGYSDVIRSHALLHQREEAGVEAFWDSPDSSCLSVNGWTLTVGTLQRMARRLSRSTTAPTVEEGQSFDEFLEELGDRPEKARVLAFNEIAGTHNWGDQWMDALWSKNPKSRTSLLSQIVRNPHMPVGVAEDLVDRYSKLSTLSDETRDYLLRRVGPYLASNPSVPEDLLEELRYQLQRWGLLRRRRSHDPAFHSYCLCTNLKMGEGEELGEDEGFRLVDNWVESGIDTRGRLGSPGEPGGSEFALWNVFRCPDPRIFRHQIHAAKRASANLEEFGKVPAPSSLPFFLVPATRYMEIFPLIDTDLIPAEWVRAMLR